MTDPKHITAAELRRMASLGETVVASRLELEAAADALDAKDARIRELEADNARVAELAGSYRSQWLVEEEKLAAAKARCERLGAFVDEVDRHRERKCHGLTPYDCLETIYLARAALADGTEEGS